jgi:hypothetical protein
MAFEKMYYSCDKRFGDFLQAKDIEIFNYILSIDNEYHNFISSIESFFNSELDDEALDIFSNKIMTGESLELSDADGDIYFPFTLQKNKLKLLESDTLKLQIMLALVLRGLKKNRTRHESLTDWTL